MRTRPTTGRARETALQIVDAACVLFARQGIRATTLDQVGQLSGTGRGQMSLFFAGKPDLIDEVVAAQVERVLQAQQPLLGAISCGQDVRDWCRLATQQYGAEDPLRCPIGSLVHELAETDLAARAALGVGLSRWRDLLADGMSRVRDQGELASGIDPEAAAAALLATYQGGTLLAGPSGDLEVLRLALSALTSSMLTGPAEEP